MSTEPDVQKHHETRVSCETDCLDSKDLNAIFQYYCNAQHEYTERFKRPVWLHFGTQLSVMARGLHFGGFYNIL